MFDNSLNPKDNIIGERFLLPEDYWAWWKLVKRVQTDNDVIYIGTSLDEYEKALGAWYRSDPME